MSDFNPFSVDAQLATVIETLRLQNLSSTRMHEENRTSLAGILKETKVTNGRVTTLEMKDRYRMGMMAGISLVAAWAWSCVQRLF